MDRGAWWATDHGVANAVGNTSAFSSLKACRHSIFLSPAGEQLCCFQQGVMISEAVMHVCMFSSISSKYLGAGEPGHGSSRRLTLL